VRRNPPTPLPASRLPPQPIGLLGGTFDPIHFGHLRLAEELAEVLDLAEVRLIPAGQPPHRATPRASGEDRLAMARLATANNPRLVVDGREIANPEPSYSVNTLGALRAEQPAGTPIILFMGSDAFLGLATWHEWQRLFDLAHIAVAQRPGFSSTLWEDALPDVLRKQMATRRCTDPAELSAKPAGRVYMHAITQMDISSRQIRDRALRGLSLRYLVPDPVIDYINEHRLYA